MWRFTPQLLRYLQEPVLRYNSNCGRHRGANGVVRVKPGDHPEFFRLPPPPGQSRESGIVLDATGRFWHRGEPVEHAGMARAFASWVGRHPDDGRYILSNGYDWSYLEVADAPYFVTAALLDREPPLWVLSSGEEEPIDPSSLSIGQDEALYAQVKGGQFLAKLTPQAQLALAPNLVELADGRIGIRVADQVFPVNHATS
jgi:hypothetical protein